MQMAHRCWLLAAIVCLALAMITSYSKSISAAGTTFVVDSSQDEPDNNPGDGICNNGQNKCTFRAALDEANAQKGPNQISFNILNNGVCPTSAVVISGNPQYFRTLSDGSYASYVITDGYLTIDAYTQCGASYNNQPIAGNAVIRIELTTAASLTTAGPFGLVINSDHNVIRGLSIYRWERSVEFRQAKYNEFSGNFVGMKANGNSGGGNTGVRLNFGSAHNVIGGETPPKRNILSGNGFEALDVQGDGVFNNHMIGNYIGVKQNGSTILANNADAVDIAERAHHNWVGGIMLDVAGQPILDPNGRTIADPNKRNVIAGNRQDGIEISHKLETQYNQIVGNWIGMDAYGNPAGNGDNGITFEDQVNNTHVYQNIIVASKANGVRFYTVHQNYVYDNWIGVLPNGTAMPNGTKTLEEGNKKGRSGVYLMGGSWGNQLLRNTIAYNHEYGIYINTEHGYLPYGSCTTRYNTFSQNSLHDNVQKGIRLKISGCVEEVGTFYSNDGVAKPNITSATTALVNGNSSCANCTVEIFIVAATDTNDFGQGEGIRFIGSGSTTTAGGFAIPHNQAAVSDKVTATITDKNGNTSEFSNNYAVVQAIATPTSTSTSKPSTPTPTTTPPVPTPTTAAAEGCGGQLTAVADSYTRSDGYANENYGSSIDLVVKAGGSGFKRRSYLKFDLNTLPSQMTNIYEARLYLYVNYLQSSEGTPLTLFASTSDNWTENGLTWSNQPALGANLAAVTATTNGWIEFDITNQLNNELNGDKIASFILWDANNTNLTIEADSREGAFAPLVIITAASCASSATTPSATQEATRTPSNTPTIAPTTTSSPTPVPTMTDTPTATASPTALVTPLPTASETTFPTASSTPSPTSSVTASETPSPTATVTAMPSTTPALMTPSPSPTTVSQTPATAGCTGQLITTADAYTRNGSYANDNYGREIKLAVKAGGTNFKRQTYLQFNLATLPSTMTSIQDARLRLYVGYVESTQAVPLTLFASSSDSWTESGLTWNNQPALGANLATTSAAHTGWLEFNITNQLNNELNGDKIASFVLWDASNANLMVETVSREGGLAPRIEITAATCNSAATATPLPEFTATATPVSAESPTPLPTTPPLNSCTQQLVVAADAYVRSGSYASNNYGLDRQLAVKAGGSEFKRQTYLKFNLNGLSMSALTEARLKLRVNSLESNSAIPLTVFSAYSDDWHEQTLTWQNRPALNDTLSSAILTSAGWVEFDVTSLITSEFMGDKVASIILWDKENSNLMIVIDSRETTFAPVLEIKGTGC